METNQTPPLYRALPLLAALLSAMGAPAAQAECTVAQAEPLRSTDPALCAALAAEVRAPSELPLDRYEARLAAFLTNWCHRDRDADWVRDKRVRDTGPFIATRSDGKDGQWSGSAHGTHGAVVIWYSREMVRWLEQHRPDAPTAAAGGVGRLETRSGVDRTPDHRPRRLDVGRTWVSGASVEPTG